jgi:hypothetical protein
MCDNGSGTNDSSIADCDSTTYHCVRTDPHVFADIDRRNISP